MQNDRRGILSMLEAYFDMFINLIAILMSFMFIAMVEWNIELPDITHPSAVIVIFANLLFASFVYHTMNLYRPTRYARRFRSFPEIFKVNFVYFGIIAVLTTFIARPGYRQLILFWILGAAVFSTAFLTFKRHVIRLVIQGMRSRQYHLRKVIIIGDNTRTAIDYIKEVSADSQSGVLILGYVGDKINQEEIDIEKLGGFKDLDKIIEKYRPTDAVFAIDAYDKRHLIKLVNMCDDRCIKVYFLPVIYGFFKNSRQIEQVGSIPLINIHSTPLDNTANAVVKRVVDIVGSSLLIILTSPIMLAAAIGVRISSPGPIFFRQKRVGKMGRRFTMIKFRSMRVNADSNSAWSTGNDPRKTKFGAFIRRTAIDELPQLFNVFMGSMSLVGPRPEIPVFVNHFREIIPLYMVKHYVKPGITGLAQIKGFRGDTSIEARIHEDIKYIEHWSLGLDLYILFKTPFKAINKSERYSTEQVKQEDTTAAQLIAAGEDAEREEAERRAIEKAEKQRLAREKIKARKAVILAKEKKKPTEAEELTEKTAQPKQTEQLTPTDETNVAQKPVKENNITEKTDTDISDGTHVSNSDKGE